MLEKTIHIDLSLPRSWNQCTTEQLETIAACIMKHTALADRYHPFDWMDVKSELFFLLTETEIIRVGTVNDDPNDTTYLCRIAKKSRRKTCNWKQRYQHFYICPWQVYCWIDTNLKWLDDEKNTLLFFPYKQLVFTRHFTRRWPFLKKTYYAPGELLQDFTWRQYRHLQDYMLMYIDKQNTLIKTMDRQNSHEQIAEQQTALKKVRDEFLKILFTPFLSTSNNNARDVSIKQTIAKSVSRITEVQWQVILLWWSGMMHYLKDHYPRCFKPTPVKKNSKRMNNPFDLYTSIIATIQDKAHIDEEKINNQTYTIVLEHLERIAKENEELDKINSKYK